MPHLSQHLIIYFPWFYTTLLLLFFHEINGSMDRQLSKLTHFSFIALVMSKFDEL